MLLQANPFRVYGLKLITERSSVNARYQRKKREVTEQLGSQHERKTNGQFLGPSKIEGEGKRRHQPVE